MRAISGVVRSRQCAHPSAIAGFSGFVPVNPVSSSSAPAAVRAIASSAPAFGDAPRPTRLPFKNLSQEDVKFFRDTVGVNTIEDADQLSSYNSDWMGVWSGDAPLVLRPRTTGATPTEPQSPSLRDATNQKCLVSAPLTRFSLMVSCLCHQRKSLRSSSTVTTMRWLLCHKGTCTWRAASKVNSCRPDYMLCGTLT